jgi:hypothetical protein
MLTCLLFAGTVFLADGVETTDKLVEYPQVASYASGEFGMIMHVETATETFEFLIDPFVQGMSDVSVIQNCIEAPIVVAELPVPSAIEAEIEADIDAGVEGISTMRAADDFEGTKEKPLELKTPANGQHLGVAPFPKEAPAENTGDAEVK